MKTIKTQVAVMGSGIAGLSAALLLANSGLQVACFEKRPFQGGGVSNTPMMTLAVRPDREYQDKAYQVHMEYTNYNANAAVVRNWLRHSAMIPSFVESFGGKFKFVQTQELDELGAKPGYTVGFPKGMNLGDYYFFESRGMGHGGAVYCKKMRDKFESLGGRFFVSTPIHEVIRDESGKICGALALDKDGEVKIECNAVVIASGGFNDDPVLIKESTGLTFTDNTASNGGNVLFNAFPAARLTGDGQKAAWKAGGARGSMGLNGQKLQPGPGVRGNTTWIGKIGLPNLSEQPYLWVNCKGQRFVNEDITTNHMAMSTAIANQPNGTSYLIFDEDTVRHMEEDGVDMYYFIFSDKKLSNIHQKFERVINEAGNKHYFISDSIEELAEKAGIDKKGLQEQVEEYNRYCDEKNDEQFCKDPKYLRHVRNGKIYAIRIFCGAYAAIGGVKIDGKCRVIDTNADPIPGLYAAGDCCAGEIWGNPPTGGIGCTSISFAQGFICAEEAEKYINGLGNCETS